MKTGGVEDLQLAARQPFCYNDDGVLGVYFRLRYSCEMDFCPKNGSKAKL